MSIHKCQGQTLSRCGVYLPEPVFTHGQLYVAASRTTTAIGLRFWLGETDGHGYISGDDGTCAIPYTHNVVFRAVRGMLSIDQPTDAPPAHEEPKTSHAVSACASLPDPTPPNIGRMARALSKASIQKACTTFEGAVTVTTLDGTEDDIANEFEDLNEMEQTTLQRLLLQCDEADPAETGAEVEEEIVSELNLLETQTRTAKRLRVEPSVWFEVKKRPASDRAIFLEAEAMPASSGGAASSSSYSAA